MPLTTWKLSINAFQVIFCEVITLNTEILFYISGFILKPIQFKAFWNHTLAVNQLEMCQTVSYNHRIIQIMEIKIVPLQLRHPQIRLSECLLSI